MKKLLPLVIIIPLLFTACSSENETSKKVEDVKNIEDGQEIITEGLSLKFKKNYSWINLMPGPKAKPTFHIAGEMELYDATDYKLETANLTQLVIIQNYKIIYTIEPIVREDENLSTENMRYLIFSSPQKIYLDDKLDSEKTIDVNFVFECDSGMFSYLVKNIKIDKAY